MKENIKKNLSYLSIIICISVPGALDKFFPGCTLYIGVIFGALIVILLDYCISNLIKEIEKKGE